MSDAHRHQSVKDDFGLAGKTALVTGFGRNIKRAIALELAAHDANLIVNAHSNEAEASAVAQALHLLGVRSLVVMGDASDLATVDQMRARAQEAFGGGGWMGNAMAIPHAAGEGGLRSLTKPLARGLGQYGITVNNVSPGILGTSRDPKTHPQITSDWTEEIVQKTPIGREPTPEELAWACAFLCSTRSAAITGMVIHVDGGLFMFT